MTRPLGGAFALLGLMIALCGCAPATRTSAVPSASATATATATASVPSTAATPTRGPGVYVSEGAKAGPENSFAAILDPIETPVVATDVAPVLLAKPGVRAEIGRYLRQKYRPLAEVEMIATFPAPDMAAIVFVPYGAIAASGNTHRFRLYGTICQSDVVACLGAVPFVTGTSATPSWLDVRTDGARPTVIAVHSIEDEWFYHSLGEDSATIRAVPDWIMQRFPAAPEDEVAMVDATARSAMLKLLTAWLAPRVLPSASAALPPGYSPSPHHHPGIEAHRQLAPAQLRLVFRPDKDASEGTGEWVDASGPDPQSGPVRLFQVIQNDPTDYSGILNESTGKGLRSPDQRGWWEFKDPVWTGDVLTVDIVLASDVGPSPTYLHCEIDWKTMTVLRAVPYGPLSPF